MRKSLTRAVPLALGLGLLAGCSDPVSTDAVQIMAVVVDDIFYTPREPLGVQAEAVGEKYTEVVRLVDCSDGLWLDGNTWVSDHCPLENGDSNFLPAGTPIHRMTGKEPGEALTVFHWDAWHPLEPIPLASADDGTGSLVPPPDPSPAMGGDR